MENNIVMENVELSLDNTKKKRFSDLPGNQLPINFKHFMGLKITLLKFIYPNQVICDVIAGAWGKKF